MINVYSKGTTVFNNNGLATLIPTSCDVKIEKNGKWQLTLSHPKDKEKRYLHLEKEAILRVTNIDCIREWESTTQMFRIYDVKKSLTSVTVIAFPLGMEATYDAPIESLVIGNKTGANAASDIDTYIKQHDGNNKYTITSNVTNQGRSEYENTNLIAALSSSDDNSFVNVWGGEVVYDNYKIKILDIIGDQSQERAYPIRYGRNLIGLDHEIDSSSVITRLYPISSDDLRLNTWSDVPDQGGTSYYDTSAAKKALYPFIRSMFVELDYSLIDTNTKSHTRTADSTETWRTEILTTMTALATTLWNTVVTDLTNTYSPEYVQELIKGDDGVSGYLQRMFTFTHKGWQSFVKSLAKQSVEWIDSATLPTWEWHEDTSVIPHAWWYGDDSTTPSTSYAKNCYVKIGKYWEYFNEDGFWLDYKRIADADMEWHEAKDGSGRKWFGSQKSHYAHNEYVYATVDGEMQEWWYDEEGWYDEDSSGASDFGWHGDSSSGIWFGEEGAESGDKSKYIHDKWAWIDGTYYWFDSYGYTDADPAHSKPDYQWGDLVDDSNGKHWFGNPDENYGLEELTPYLISQWAKIDGEWQMFDSDGYAIDMTAKKSELISWMATTIYNGSIDYVKARLTQAYTLLYEQMEAWCQNQYDHGLDSPSIDISVDLIDLSKTTEYSSYSELERIALGDKVMVVDNDNNEYFERVLGLSYDCINCYNTKVEIGGLSKSVSQIIKVSFNDSNNETKLVAGDNVTIDGKVISVSDYVGRAVGLQDVLVNGSTIVNGNIASLGIAAGSNISISRSGNTLTINAVGGSGDVNLYYGLEPPSNSIGDDKDLYALIKSNSYIPSDNHEGTHSRDYGAQKSWNDKWNFVVTGTKSYAFDSFILSGNINLTNGKRYKVRFSAKMFSQDVTYTNTKAGDGFYKWYAVVIHNYYYNTYQSDYSDDTTAYDGDTAEKTGASHEVYLQSLIQDNEWHDYEYEFTAHRDGGHCIQIDTSGVNGNIELWIQNLELISVNDYGDEIESLYVKVGNEWLLKSDDKITDILVDGESVVDEKGIANIEMSGQTYTAGTNIQISAQNVISATDTTYDAFEAPESAQGVGTDGLVPAPTYAEVQAEKVLGANGRWVDQEGGVEIVILDSYEDYEALTPAQKNNPTKEYLVKNIPTTDGLPFEIVNGKLCIVYDDGEE